MSYVKYTTTPKKIRFYFSTTTLYERISETTAHKAVLLSSMEKGADFDLVAVSADENSIIKKYIEEAMLEIFSPLEKIMTGSMGFDETFTPPGGSETTGYFGDVTDNEKGREITLQALSKIMENAIVDFCVYRWYILRGLSDDAQAHYVAFGNGLRRIMEVSMILWI